MQAIGSSVHPYRALLVAGDNERAASGCRHKVWRADKGTDVGIPGRNSFSVRGLASCYSHAPVDTVAAVSQGPLRKQEHSEVRHAVSAIVFPCVALATSWQVCIVLSCPLVSRRPLCALPGSCCKHVSQMATAMKDAVKPGVEEAAPVHRIRITLSSRNVKNLEKGALTPSPAPPLPV